MKYLITGGAGFIGSHLADALLDRGDSVHVLDNLSTGSGSNIEHLHENPDFDLTIGNVLDYHTLEGLVENADRVVHLAAAVGVKLIMEQPVETLVTNIQGTENVLKLCWYHRKRVLVASTSEVYGKTMEFRDGMKSLHEEDDLTLGPTSRRRWAYGCSKALDEFLSRAYYDSKGLEVVCTRFFNTVGPRQTGQYGMVVPRFVQHALAGEPIVIHGDGRQTRCFTHVADAVKASLLLLDSDAAIGQVVNVGYGEAVSVKSLAQRIKRMTGSKSPLEYVSYEQVYGPGYEDMRDRTPDISRLRELTGFVPERSLDETLGDVVSYYRPAHYSVRAG